MDINIHKAAKKEVAPSKWPIIISVIALIISCGSIYLQYFYKYDDVKVTILSAMPNTLAAGLPAFESDLVFVNNGNQACSITQIYLEQQDLDDTKYPGSAYGPNLNESPFTLKSNDVVTIKIKARTNKLMTGFVNRKTQDRIEFRLVFEVIDSKGNYHKIKVPVFEGVMKGSKGELASEMKDLIDFPKVVILLPTPLEKNNIPFPIILPKK